MSSQQSNYQFGQVVGEIMSDWEGIVSDWGEILVEQQRRRPIFANSNTLVWCEVELAKFFFRYVAYSEVANILPHYGERKVFERIANTLVDSIRKDLTLRYNAGTLNLHGALVDNIRRISRILFNCFEERVDVRCKLDYEGLHNWELRKERGEIRLEIESERNALMEMEEQEDVDSSDANYDNYCIGQRSEI